MKVHKREEVVTYKIDKPEYEIPIAGRFIDGDFFSGVLGRLKDLSIDNLYISYFSFLENEFVTDCVDWEKIKTNIEYWVYLSKDLDK